MSWWTCIRWCVVAVTTVVASGSFAHAQQGSPTTPPSNSPFDLPPPKSELPTEDSGLCDSVAGHEPAMSSFDAAGFGSPRIACLASSDRAFVRSVLGVGEASFTDATETSLYAQRRWAIRNVLEVELGARLVAMKVTEGEDTTFDFGSIVVGAANGDRAGWFGLEGRWLAELRIELPRTGTELDLTAASASPSLTWSVRLGSSAQLHNRVGLILFATPGTTPVASRASGALASDLTFSVSKLIGVAAGVEARAGHGSEVTELDLEQVVVRAGLSIGGDLAGTLSAAVPVTGEQQASGAVFVGVRRRR